MEIFISLIILGVIADNFRRKSLFAWKIKHFLCEKDNYMDGPSYVHHCSKHHSGWAE